MEDLQGLVESTIERDLRRLSAITFCTFYKPLKLRPFHSANEFDKFKKDDFSGFPCSYESRDSDFHLYGVYTNVQIRFVELLAPLTLYHVSKASKIMYYDCLDIRGLEFWAVHYGSWLQFPEVSTFNGMEGRFNGLAEDWRFRPYSIYHGLLYMALSAYVEARTNFVASRFKVLKLVCQQPLFDDHIVDLCAAVFHKETEHVSLMILCNCNDTELLSLTQLTIFFDFCKQVKTLAIRYRHHNPSVPPYAARFLEIKDMIEKWSTKNRKLEIFTLEYMDHFFQLHNNVLKRLVKIDEKWFWSDKCDIDAVNYRKYERPESTQDLNMPMYYQGLHHDDVLGIPPNLSVQECVKEVLKIPGDRAELIAGKKGQNIKWIESTFHVKLILVQTDRKLTVEQKFLAIGGKPADVAQAKQHVECLIN